MVHLCLCLHLDLPSGRERPAAIGQDGAWAVGPVDAPANKEGYAVTRRAALLIFLAPAWTP